MSDHEKRRLVRGIELEKRRYIGFTKTPVIDDQEKHYPDGVEPRAKTDPDQEYYGRRGKPWVDG